MRRGISERKGEASHERGRGRIEEEWSRDTVHYVHCVE